MEKRIISILVIISAFMMRASAQQCVDNNLLLKYNKGILTKLSGSGELYDYGHNNYYNRIYYLFTNNSYIYISNKYIPKGEKGYDNLAIQKSDPNLYWFRGDDGLGSIAEQVVSYKSVQSGTVLGVHWNKRVQLLFDTKNQNEKNPKCTVLLVVLPMPPDSLFTYHMLEEKKIQNGHLTGNLIIGRTGRIVFDSIWVNGVPQRNTRYNEEGNERDTPYYSDNPHAKVVIDTTVKLNQKHITVTVFYRQFGTNGIKTGLSKDIEVPIRTIAPIYIIAAVAIVLVMLIVILIRLIIRNKKKNGSTRMRRNKCQSTLLNPTTSNEAQIVNYENQIEELKRQLQTQTLGVDEFHHRCETAINCMTDTYNNLKNSGHIEAAEEVQKMMARLFQLHIQ